ncbi:hypothetical protein U0070_011944, partial [Myodes glareolus]
MTYIWAVIFSSTLTYILLQLSYCGPNVINHFCCEYSALLSVSCSDTSFSQMACLAISMFNEACCLLIIITSYVFIVVTVLKIPTKGALRKAFSTCASHLTAIGVCHGIVLLLYCVLKSKSSLFLVKVATVFHSMVIPMLNPLIYSLRNKDVKETVRNSNVIDHFFCDLPPLLSLACSDVTVNKVLLFVVATFKESMSIVIIFTSYLFILITIPRMRSAEGRQKAFSTCATHLTAITVFMEHFLSIYCPSTSETSGDANKVSTVFYTVVIPMPNPLIYSLRNK